jgi:hypothetical protein
MYKQCLNSLSKEITSVQRLDDGAFIPFDTNNVDYIIFKRDLSNSVDINDANGIPLTNQQKRDLYVTLP